MPLSSMDRPTDADIGWVFPSGLRINVNTSPSSLSMRSCMLSDEPEVEDRELGLRRALWAAYWQDALSPRFTQLSHGAPRLHLSLSRPRLVVVA